MASCLATSFEQMMQAVPNPHQDDPAPTFKPASENETSHLALPLRVPGGSVLFETRMAQAMISFTTTASFSPASVRP